MEKRNVIIDKDAHIRYKNFSGRESEMNPLGARNFCLDIDPEIADQLQAEGWNVKWTKPQEDGDVATPFIKVNVKYGNFPPRIWTVTSRGKTLLEEGDVYQLDKLRIIKIMLTVNPFEYKPGRLSGYVDEMYVTIAPSAFEDEYGDIPDNTNR